MSRTKKTDWWKRAPRRKRSNSHHHGSMQQNGKGWRPRCSLYSVHAGCSRLLYCIWLCVTATTKQSERS